VKEEVVRTKYFIVIEIQKDSCVLKKGANKLKPRRSREKYSKEVPEIENQGLAERQNTEESFVR